MDVPASPDRNELEQAHCWFEVDRVSKEPLVTAFKRRARLHQARWREEQKVAMGSHMSGRPPEERANGSRIDLKEAKGSGVNLLSDSIRKAARARLKAKEAHETLDVDRLWSDLLSSMPMCFNLFGELHADAARLADAVDTLWPNHPGVASEVRFEWSPGRRDSRYLNDRTAFDAAVLLDLSDETRGVIGVETKYHEHTKPEKLPTPARMAHYEEIAEKSGAFNPGWQKAILGTGLQQIWRDHLLVLAMLQSDTGWTWGRYMLVHPTENPSFGEAAAEYLNVLADRSTFEVRTIEELLDEHVLHPPEVEAAFRRRYLW